MDHYKPLTAKYMAQKNYKLISRYYQIINRTISTDIIIEVSDNLTDFVIEHWVVVVLFIYLLMPTAQHSGHYIS